VYLVRKVFEDLDICMTVFYFFTVKKNFKLYIFTLKDILLKLNNKVLFVNIS